MSETPLVSICCLAFNHEPFIRQCLDGFLMQETTFGIEILIHDDASTDNTADIIRAYADKYPDIIFPIYETENKYSHGFKGKMDIVFNYSRARGKYIASCEGDDYWTDPHKLQKQVDFMESHPEYSVCFHRCQHLNTYNGAMTDDRCGRLFRDGKEGIDITADRSLGNWITQPLTMLFRKDCFDPNWQKQYKYYRDMHEIYHLLSVGKGYLFSFVGGVYRYHAGGIHSMISNEQYCTTALPIDEEFYRINRTRAAKRNYLFTLQDCIKYYTSTDKWKALGYILKHFKVSHDLHLAYKEIIRLFKHATNA